MISVFKALLLCDGVVLAWVVLMSACMRHRPWRFLGEAVLIVGSGACPLACPELAALYLGTGPVWHLLDQPGHGLARLDDELEKNNVEISKKDE